VKLFLLRNALKAPLAFFERQPALFIGMLILFGASSSLFWHSCYAVITLLLLLPFVFTRRFSPLALYALCGFFLGFISAEKSVPKLDLHNQKLQGTAVFYPESLSVHHSPFQRSLQYKGVLKDFEGVDGTKITRMPCSIFMPISDDHPRASAAYRVEGSLAQKERSTFFFKPNKKKDWEQVPSTFSFAEWRYNAKRAVADFLKEHYTSSSSATFLSAIVTGEVDDRILRLEFSRVGLQHILGISGFQFAFFAVILSTMLRFILPYRYHLIALLIGLSAYYFFLGNSPAIKRAYVAISLYILGMLIGKRINGLNALGAGLIIETLFEPAVIMQLSFQLSFLCTLAILLVYPLSTFLCLKLLPERPLSELKRMTLIDQHGYLMCSFLRNSLSINFAIHLLSFPVLLCLFHKFPVLSLFYNLFLPFCYTISLFLFFVALFASFLPFLGNMIHSLNDFWTSQLLFLSTHPPAYFSYTWRSQSFSFPVTAYTIFILFYLSLLFLEWKRAEEGKLLPQN